ncbi:aminotransferase [Siminovitchia terrae]|uniref:Aminotransferase n=1 Tax=Siminovitchia terrae TaxID=1914933 RepID=A0A429X617_SIMTE|nr:aminotransferase A [Siminovitchia terrae]RST58819.1 aminotransferase A [Siminovitchia terrae]GIN89316.1 aminotransferase [Siminovitchia terrae]GIN95380.1 aminotransferase [Siminovitchia terrae]
MIDFMNPRLDSIHISGIRKIASLAEKDPDVINMTLGQPDFPTPEHIKEAGKRAIDDNKTAYTHTAGMFELRTAVNIYMNRKYGLNYQPEDEILITAGASQAIDTALRTILEEGSEVIIPMPIFPGYEPIVKLLGAVPVYIDTTKNGFKVNADMIKEKITERTRCIILSYPSNPTGRTLNAEEIMEIAELLKEKNIFILSDEIYSELLYENKHYSIASVPKIRDKTIVINGLSKSHAMTGWRVGIAMGPSDIILEMSKVHLYNTTCASSISQYAALEALTKETGDVRKMVTEYKKRRDYIYSRLVDGGLSVYEPEGAFYLFPSIKNTGMTSMEFALKLLEEEKVAVVPGDAFSEFGEGYIRISYACSMDQLVEGSNRIERFIKKYMDYIA